MNLMSFVKNAALSVLNWVGTKAMITLLYILMGIAIAILVGFLIFPMYSVGFADGAMSQENWTNKNLDYICRKIPM